MKKIICIIPARKNSKRLVGKNSKNFFGKPLLFWTLNFANKLKFVDKVILSSDCNEILRTAKPFKKIIRHLRAKKLARDKTVMWDVVKNILDKIKSKKNINGIILLQPTTPYRDLKKFNEYLKKFRKKTDNFYSVSTKHKNNHKCYIKNRRLFFYKKGKRCYQTGSLILISLSSFLEKKSFRIDNSKPIISSRAYENFDIDYQKDFDESYNFFKKNKKFQEYFLCKNL